MEIWIKRLSFDPQRIFFVTAKQLSKKIRIINPWIINPFFGYGLFWSLAIFLYLFSPSKANLSLDINLIMILLITIVVSFFCAHFFNKKFKNKIFEIKYKKPSIWISVVLLILYIAEFIYSGQIPIVSTINGSGGAYKAFGIPTLHVLIVTFGIFYGIYHAYMFLCFRKRHNVIRALMVLLYFLLIFSRGMLIFCGVVCILLYFASKKIKIRHIIFLFVLALIAMFIFGALGNIRSGFDWNDTGYLLGLAKIDADPYGFFSPLYWVEEYIICSLRNLNYNVSFGPDYSVEAFLSSVVPDFIGKRIFDVETSVRLYVPAFTTSTMYAATYISSGYLGMLISFGLYLLSAKIVMSIRMSDASCELISYSMLFFLFAMSIFDNMLVYSGYSFALVFAILYGVRHFFRVFDHKRQTVSIKV